jgi:hypothetical protein
MYGSRAVLVAGYLLAPRTELTFYVFAAGLGFTWLATVPPTAAIVGKLFGVRYLATLFGLTLLSHQIGGFLGAWLGGLVITRFGDFGWMWYADIVLAAARRLLNLPIREAPVEQGSCGGLRSLRKTSSSPKEVADHEQAAPGTSRSRLLNEQGSDYLPGYSASR